jgi:hypothetical protein
MEEGSRSEVRGFQNFVSRFSRQFHPSRLSQTSAVTVDVSVNNAGWLVGNITTAHTPPAPTAGHTFVPACGQ